MGSTNENAMPRRRLEFYLVTLLATIAALFVLMAVGYWFGWVMLWGLFLLADCLGAVAVTLLPVMVLALGRSTEARERIGKAFVIAGSLLVVHLAVMALSVEFTLRAALVLDLSPIDGLMSLTLNWTVPAAIAGLLIGIVFGRSIYRLPSCWVGAMLTAGGCLAFVWYGHYFFETLLGTTLAKNVWWL